MGSSGNHKGERWVIINVKTMQQELATMKEEFKKLKTKIKRWRLTEIFRTNAVNHPFESVVQS